MKQMLEVLHVKDSRKEVDTHPCAIIQLRSRTSTENSSGLPLIFVSHMKYVSFDCGDEFSSWQSPWFSGVRFWSCQWETQMWSCRGHRLNKTGQLKNNVPSSLFLLRLQTVGSHQPYESKNPTSLMSAVQTGRQRGERNVFLAHFEPFKPIKWHRLWF